MLRKIAYLTFIAIFMTSLSLELSLSASQEAAEKPRYGGLLRLGWYTKPAPLDPFNVTDTISSPLMEVVFNRLVRLNTQGEYEGDLAEHWDISEGGLVYTFYLRRNVKFHDGTECTARDVLHTFQLISNKEISPTFYKNYGIVKECKALSKYIFQIILKEPFSPLMRHLWRAPIVPRHKLEDPQRDLKSFIKRPIGTGPFEFVDQKEAGDIWLKAHEGYFEGRPYLDEIHVKIFPAKGHVWSAFLREELDMLFYLDRRDYNEIKSNPSFKTFRTLLEGGYALMFNLHNELLSDPKIREAIDSSINRKELIEYLEEGEGVLASGPFHPESWAHNPKVNLPDYEPRKAEKLLQEAGFIKKEDGILERNGQRLFFNLLVNFRNEHLIKMAKIIRQQLQEIGVGVKLQLFSSQRELTEMVYRDDSSFHCYLFVFSSGPVPDTVSIYWETSRIFNWGHYSNSKVDHQFVSARRTHNKVEKLKAYHEIHRIIAKDRPVVFLYFPYVLHAVSTDILNVDGLTAPFVPFDLMKDVYRRTSAMRKGGE